MLAGDKAQIQIFQQRITAILLHPLRHDDRRKVGLFKGDRVNEGARHLVDFVAARWLRQQLQIADQLMGAQLVTGGAIVGTCQDAEPAADIGRLTAAGHVHGFQHLGAWLGQVELSVDGITRLDLAIGDRDYLVTDIGGNDKLLDADLVIWNLQPAAVVIEDHQGGVVAPFPLVIAGIPDLLAEFFDLDIGQTGGELLGVKLEREAQPGDALADHVLLPVGALLQHIGVTGLAVGMQLPADQIAIGADQIIAEPEVADAGQLGASQHQGEVQPFALVLLARLFCRKAHQTGRDHPTIDTALVTGGRPQYLAALAGAGVVTEAGLFHGEHHSGAHHC